MVHLIFGGNGFIGSNLASTLTMRNEKVVILDRISNQIFKDRFDSFLQPKFLECNLEDSMETISTLKRALSSQEKITIWHLAANSDIRLGISDPNVDLEDTFATTITAIEVAKKFECHSINFASSSAIFGDNHGIPIAEENAIPTPISNYGNMKLASEHALKIFCGMTDMRLRIFRFPNVVGWPTTHGVIFDFYHQMLTQKQVLKVLGNGNQKKPYVHVHDLVDIMIYLNDTPNRLEVFNIAPNDSGVTVKFIAEALTAKIAPKAQIQYGESNIGWFGDVPKYSFDVSKLMSQMGDIQLSSEGAIDRVISEIHA